MDQKRKRESVRGKLQYYQELINQEQEMMREEGELDEEIEEPHISYCNTNQAK